jgi:hypothetical protein
MIERNDAKNIAYLLSQIRNLSHSHLPVSHGGFKSEVQRCMG